MVCLPGADQIQGEAGLLIGYTSQLYPIDREQMHAGQQKAHPDYRGGLSLWDWRLVAELSQVGRRPAADFGSHGEGGRVRRGRRGVGRRRGCLMVD